MRPLGYRMEMALPLAQLPVRYRAGKQASGHLLAKRGPRIAIPVDSTCKVDAR